MIDNDTKLITLNSNDDDISNLISLRRNRKDHVPRIREYYEEVIPRYTDLQLDFQFRHHFRMSRPTVQQLCLLMGNCPQVPIEFCRFFIFHWICLPSILLILVGVELLLCVVCHSIPECCVMFSGVKLKWDRLFYFNYITCRPPIQLRK